MIKLSNPLYWKTMPASSLSNYASTVVENIAILNRVRLVAIVGQILLILISLFYFEISLPIIPIAILLVLESLFEIYGNKQVANVTATKQWQLLLHIIFDSLILMGLIYYTGGANNPFIYLLLLPVALGSFMLVTRHLIFLVIFELILYSLLNIYQRPLALGESSPLSSFHLHLAGMWVNFILTVVLLAVFGLITRSTMLKQEKNMQRLREKHLQDEQILGLGIMSASAAHELGTPLSTMAIVIDDIQHSNISKEQQQDMTVLSEQIGRCKDIIAQLGTKSRHAQQQLSKQNRLEQTENSQESIQINFKQQIRLIVEQWLVYQPRITIVQDWEQGVENINYIITLSLEQAISNLLDNAADASLENGYDNISLTIYLKRNDIVLDIRDNGKGISLENKNLVGKQIQPTNKQDGLGWGMFLSNVSVERAGGSVQIINCESDSQLDCKQMGGSLTRINLPLRD